MAWKLGVCYETLLHVACQGLERGTCLRAPGRQPDGGKRANSEERPRPDTQDCMCSRVCTASRRVGASPTPTTVRLPLSGPFYSPSRLRLTFIVYGVLLKRHQMVKGSKPTRRWFSDHLLEWFRSQRVPSPNQHSNKARASLPQQLPKPNCGPPSAGCSALPCGRNCSPIPLPSGGFITFFWVNKGLTIIVNTFLLLCLRNLYCFSYALVSV